MSFTRSTLVVTGILATALSLAACTATSAPTGSSIPSSPIPSSTPNITTFNDPDIAFAMGMVPHHKQAVEMADLILAKQGIDPRVTDLARRIKAAQGPEITMMTGWLTTWGSPLDSMGSMPGMDMGTGLMSQKDMTDLGAATGVTASKLFLTQMTVHHQGALTMATAEISDGENSAAIELANAIMKGQSAEIAEMATILASLR